MRLEIDKLRLSTEQLAFSKLLEVRMREYPALYSMFSELLKAVQGETSLELDQLLSRVNEWDSQHSIFMDPETSNICYAFRAMLRAEAIAESSSRMTPALLKAAERLELALRSDIGIHGISVIGSDLSPRQRKGY